MKHHSVSSMIKELLYSDKAHNSAAYATSGAEAAIGTAYPSREPEFIPFLVWFVLVFYVVFCRWNVDIKFSAHDAFLE
jgi:hypothetical protein